MRKLIGVALAALAISALIYFFRGGEAEVGGVQAASAPSEVTPLQARSAPPMGGVRAGAVVTRGSTAAAVDAAAAEEARHAGTPPLEIPATEKDGFAEIEVKSAGQPFAGAQVTLYWRGARDRATGLSGWRVAGAGTTGADGVVRIPARAGAYLASAHAEHYAPERREFVRPQAQHATRVALELRPGLSLSGRTVTGSAEEAVPLAAIVLTQTLRPQRRERRADSPPEEQPRATADTRGHFHVEGLAPGSWRVEAQATGYANAAVANVAVPRASELVLMMQAAGYIEGTVLTAEGKPAAGAQVAASSGPARATAVASDKGAFSLEVEPRAYKLSAARGQEAGTLERSVSVAAGATERNVTIQLGPGSSIDGTVVNAAGGTPVPGAQIALTPNRGEGAAGAATSDQSGAFTLEGLAPGSYDLSTTAAGFSADTRRGITVLQGQHFPLRIELQGVGSVEGIVRSAVTSTSVAGAHVTATQPGAGGQGGMRGGFLLQGALPPSVPPEVVTDAAGHYRLDNLPAGRALVQARRDGSDLGDSQSVEIIASGAARADFSLHDEGVVTGRVTRKSGGPLTSVAHVRALASGGGFMMGGGMPVSDADPSGAYRLVLPAGTYNVIASTDSTPGFAVPRSRNVAVVTAGQTTNKDLALDDDPTDVGLSGIVLEPGGAPSPGAMVRIGGGARMLTDDQGAFQIAGLRSTLPSTLDVSASNGGRTGHVTVGPEQTKVTLQLQPGAKLRGHAAGSTPVQGFRVTISQLNSSGGPMRMPNQDLEFAGDHFEVDDVPPEQVAVSISTRDGRAGQATAALSSGQVGEVSVQLKDVVSAAGRVVALDGTPISGARVIADGGPPLPGGVTTADGRFTLSNLLPGAHTLDIYQPPGTHKSQAFTVTAGQPLDLGEIQLGPPRAAPGTIGASVRQDGNGVTVTYVLPAGPADQAGLQLGDQLVTVDGAPATNASDTGARLRGVPGTQVTIAVRRAGNATVIVATRAQ